MAVATIETQQPAPAAPRRAEPSTAPAGRGRTGRKPRKPRKRAAADAAFPRPPRRNRWLGVVRRMLASLAAVARPVTDRVRKPLSVVTPLGYGALGVAAGSGLLAATLGWKELLALAVTLGVTVLIAVGFVLGRPSYEVEVSLASARVVVGERAVGELRIRNAASRPVAPALIELPVGRATAPFPLPGLAAGELHEVLFTVPTQRRAVLTLGPVRSVRQDPLGLLRRQLDWTEPEQIYIHPRTIRLANDSTGLLRDLEGLTTRDLSPDDVAFHALREYTPGDDLRHVHWRSTARTGRLMIRQFEETRRSQLVIMFSSRLADYADEDELELGLSIAASLAVSAVIEGKSVAVFNSDQRMSSGTPATLLDAFSAVEPSLSAEGFADRARVVTAEVPGASVVALISGSATPPPDLRLASLRVPSTAHSFAVRACIHEQLGRVALGDLAIAGVPRLEDLPLAIRVVTA